MSGPTTQTEGSSSNRARLAVFLRWAMEAVTLSMVVLAPWGFGAVHPASILLLYLGLSSTLFLWSMVILLEKRVPFSRCPTLLCFAGMVGLGVFQLIPFNAGWLEALSASTASVRAELFPQQLEGLLGEEAVYPPTWTLSLDAGATRNRVVQLLALLALFAAVRFAIASPGSFRRFAVACTINGALLSILAMAQRFSSSPETIYWSYPSLGSAYGPFVCKNNFPDYVNVCLFLGVGLLLRSPASGQKGKSIAEWLADLGHNPAALWLISAVGLMVTGIMFSMSRGGAIALTGGVLCCLALTFRARKFGTSLGLLALVGILTLGSVAWFGAGEINDRLGTLAGNDPNQGRREIWTRTVHLVARFPFWGSGLGTFESVEPQTRQPGDEGRLNWEHAHNDYLEALIEGGLINLTLLLLGVFFAFRGGIRAINRFRNRADGALAIGGLCGFAAVVLHSFGDFGIHIPAVALLVAVLLAHLTALGDPPDSPTQPRTRWMVVPTIAACAIVAVVVPIDGWFRERADHYRLAAVRAGNRLPPSERDVVIRYLQTAAEFAPDDAAIRLRLAEAEYEEYLARRNRSDATQSIQSQLVDSHLRPALRNYLRLRAMNPLYAESHARLAGNRQYLQCPDSVKNYLDRATRLRPTEEGLWYLSGMDRLANNDLDKAWEDWRSSLTCAPTYLSSILPAAVARIGPAQTAATVFPANPELLQKAALTPPLCDKLTERRQFAARAVDRIAELSLTRKDDLYARAWLLREAGRTKDAIAAYETALLLATSSVEWRLELAELLFDKRDFEGAEGHLRQVLREKPDLLEARELNKAIVHARARSN
jgi:O-antigen ligase/tetratricopeptide (TPR) repeat protein